MTQSPVPAIQTRSFAKHREGFRTVASRRLGVQRRGARAPLSRDVPCYLDTECTLFKCAPPSLRVCLPVLSQREPARTSLYRHKTHFFKCIFSRNTKGVRSQSKRIAPVVIAVRPLFALVSSTAGTPCRIKLG